MADSFPCYLGSMMLEFLCKHARVQNMELTYLPQISQDSLTPCAKMLIGGYVWWLAGLLHRFLTLRP